jgi:cyclopropane fatty-acyl-phospholipid synthase-like methyltransferase
MRSPSPDSDVAEHVARVADYYDANTRRFLLVNESSIGAIHRGVWTPEVTSKDEAADTVNRLMIERLRDHLPETGGRVLDLGCGVGATMVRLARATDAHVTGVTISQVQAEFGAKRFAAEGLAERCHIVCADFADLPAEPRYHAMVAIEAVVHSPSLADLIPALAARLHPGGRLIVCDDWMTDKDRGLPARERCLAQFRAGWRIGSLHTVAELADMADRAGLRLVEDQDLTSYLRLGRPRDRLVNLALGATRALPWIRDRVVEIPFWANMIGGSALQTGLSRRWLEYRLLVLERAARPAAPRGTRGRRRYGRGSYIRGDVAHIATDVTPLKAFPPPRSYYCRCGSSGLSLAAAIAISALWWCAATGRGTGRRRGR